MVEVRVRVEVFCGEQLRKENFRRRNIFGRTLPPVRSRVRLNPLGVQRSLLKILLAESSQIHTKPGGVRADLGGHAARIAEKCVCVTKVITRDKCVCVKKVITRDMLRARRKVQERDYNSYFTSEFRYRNVTEM